uniref:Uncharacterized protein n=1 Tax=Aeromonas hydrophila TaxID=644 RepID=Q5YL04_AERHY|nr:unknown [Aeromonas hydrophila]
MDLPYPKVKARCLCWAGTIISPFNDFVPKSNSSISSIELNNSAHLGILNDSLR